MALAVGECHFIPIAQNRLMPIIVLGCGDCRGARRMAVSRMRRLVQPKWRGHPLAEGTWYRRRHRTA